MAKICSQHTCCPCHWNKLKSLSKTHLIKPCAKAICSTTYVYVCIYIYIYVDTPLALTQTISMHTRIGAHTRLVCTSAHQVCYQYAYTFGNHHNTGCFCVMQIVYKTTHHSFLFAHFSVRLHSFQNIACTKGMMPHLIPHRIIIDFQ